MTISGLVDAHLLNSVTLMCVQNSPLRKSASVGDWIFDSKQVGKMSPFAFVSLLLLEFKSIFRQKSTLHYGL